MIRNGTKSSRRNGLDPLLEANDWSAEVVALFDEDGEQDDDLDSEGAVASQLRHLRNIILYQAAFALTIWIDELFDQKASLQNEAGRD